jgi:hypothetical protein
MTRSDAFYGGFADAIIDTDPKARPKGIDQAFVHRFAIYRNNVHRGLYDALAAAYPTIHKLVGVGFFDQLARDFVAAEQTRPGSLALYGAGFAAFLESHEAVSNLPYLSDIARLERARLEALNATDAVPLAASDLAGKEDELATMKLAIHPACRLIASEFPIHGIWQAQNNAGAAPQAKAQIIHCPEAVLITRPAMQVEMRVLDPAQAAFAKAIVMDGKNLEAAYLQAVEIDDAFDVTRNFAEFLIAGAFDARTH